MAKWMDYLRYLHRRRQPVRHSPTLDLDGETDFLALQKQVDAYTVTSLERQYALYKAVEYVVRHNIPGDFVECGVFRGGSSMLAALAFRQFGDESRRLMLFDTYTGMSEPTGHDQRLGGVNNGPLMKWHDEQQEGFNAWCYCSLEDVRSNMESTAYPPERIAYIQGKVEDTLADHLPEKVSILRLDTDFYESTKVEMEMLYPRLSSGGVLILDDYGLWLGSRKAVDDYFAQHQPAPLMTRVDKPGRLAVKP